MDWDDEFNAGYGGMAHGGHHASAMPDDTSLGCLDPTDISDPASAYFLLSDDAQDEITGTGKKKMKCLSCGHRFMGEIYDRCPECFSSDTKWILSQEDAGYWRQTEELESPNFFRHAGLDPASRNRIIPKAFWIPAFAGMTIIGAGIK